MADGWWLVFRQMELGWGIGMERKLCDPMVVAVRINRDTTGHKSRYFHIIAVLGALPRYE